jgi:hypothetical protein
MPTLNQGLEIFANWQTLLLGLAIYVMSFGLRRVVETGWSGAKKNKWWNEVVLPLTPVALGILLALVAKKFPWPMPVSGSFSARAMYGVACGVFCGWLYSRVRSFMKAGQDEKAAKDKDAPPEIGGPETPKVEVPKIETSKSEDPKIEIVKIEVEAPKP